MSSVVSVCCPLSDSWGALHKIGRFRNVPTVGTNLENRTFGVP